ncbi:MAG TPA: serine/threonine-protein kinase [Aggregatilineales bacterium]|nr:serine/threonine-protein kinase [Aggregatilineales bacterium]
MLRESLEGQTLNGYALHKLIGGGSMGAVFRAEHSRFPMALAVKVLSTLDDDEPDVLDRFQREASLLRALDHANIVPILDYGEADGLCYFVMPLIDGPSLERLMAQREFSPLATRNILAPLASALTYAHSHHIIHRDVKPGNVMLEPRNGLGAHVYLMDFGLGKWLESSHHPTGARMTLGTPQYMAPEQVIGANVDHRADLYSLTVVLYQMLLGRLPFEHESVQIIALRHVESLPPPPRSLNTRFPKGLQNVLLRGLAKYPDDRYQTAAELHDAFFEALRSMSEAERKATYRTESRA